MSYKTTVNKYCANRAVALSELWTRIEAMGWTLHDNQDASSYRVYKSTAEDATRLTGYIKIQWTTSNTIGLIAYYWWNATTHAGLGAAYNAAELTFATSESGFYLWIWGDKNIVALMTKISSTYYNLGFGHILKRYHDSPETALTENAASGSNVTITVGDTTGFIAGNYYQIIGAGGEGRDRVLVSSITNGTQMVISNLPRAYNSGSVIGACPMIFGVSQQNWTYFHVTCPANASGTANSSGYLISRGVIDTTKTIPDARCQLYLFGGIEWHETTASYQNFTGYIDENMFDIGSVGMAQEDVFGVGVSDSGVSTGGNGATTLNDTSKNWGSLTGKVVVIDGGLSAALGQVRKISSNTATELTVTPNWDAIPDATSTYKICDEAYRYFTTSRIMREGV